MNDPQLQDRIRSVKSKIEKLIEQGRLDEAKAALKQYEAKMPGDPEICSMQAVIHIIDGDLDKAEAVLLGGLKKDSVHFDLLFNLAYIRELEGKGQEAVDLYCKAKTVAYEYAQRRNVDEAIDRIKAADESVEIRERARIVFFVKAGMDSFLEDIILGLSDDYWVRKIIVSNLKQIDDGMEWADICWFEWCDELIIYGSKRPLAHQKKIVCRLHSYEAFTEYIYKVTWKNVDKAIFIAEHIRDYVLSKACKLQAEQTAVITNGVDLNRYMFKNRSNGFNVAYVGYINYKKGPMLLLHTFKSLYDQDSRYKLFIAGEFQDERDELYFDQMIREFGIEDNVIYDGWQDNVDQWLEDKNYILCTSVLESQNMSVMQAMCKGIKPIVHNFVGARGIYTGKYIWNTIDEAVESIRNEQYNSEEYRSFVTENYSLYDKLNEIKILIQNIANNKAIYLKRIAEDLEIPLVTVGIINYNCIRYLYNCVQSFLNQTYPNLEILLIDDFSTDGSREIIEQLESEHDNIRAIYHTSNSGGPAKGTQEIFSQAKGKYVQWIASDDYVAEDAIENFVYYMEHSPEKDYVYCNFNIVNEDNLVTGQWVYNLYEPEEIVHRIFNTGSGVIPMNGLYRTDYLRENNIEWIIYKGNDFSCDTLNTLQFIKNNWRYGMVKENLINYRVHSENASHNLGKRITTTASLFDYIISNFSEEIYFPQIDWNAIPNRSKLKKLLLAKFYFQIAREYLRGERVPNYIAGTVTKLQMKQYVDIYIKEGMIYLDEASKKGNDYNALETDIKSEYSEFYQNA